MKEITEKALEAAIEVHKPFGPTLRKIGACLPETLYVLMIASFSLMHSDHFHMPLAPSAFFMHTLALLSLFLLAFRSRNSAVPHWNTLLLPAFILWATIGIFWAKHTWIAPHGLRHWFTFALLVSGTACILQKFPILRRRIWGLTALALLPATTVWQLSVTFNYLI